MLLPTIIFGQPLKVNQFDEIFKEADQIFSKWNEYLADCNQIVADTITQHGSVQCELVAVKMNGKIISYTQVPIDTTWKDCKCRDYQTIDYNTRNFTLSGNNLITSTSSGWTISDSYLEAEPAKNIFRIERDKICWIKKRKASFEDFFERWLVEKGVIKFN